MSLCQWLEVGEDTMEERVAQKYIHNGSEINRVTWKNSQISSTTPTRRTRHLRQYKKYQVSSIKLFIKHKFTCIYNKDPGPDTCGEGLDCFLINLSIQRSFSKFLVCVTYCIKWSLRINLWGRVFSLPSWR